MVERDAVARNIAAHNRVADRYETIHAEIFNTVEQERLRTSLARAAELVGPEAPTALDFGCGTGNLAGHLAALGFRVTAADVADRFLDMLQDRFATFRLNGVDLAGLDDDSFDLVATYSVLHHVPDYLAAVRELARVSRGVVYIDHEASPGFWAHREEHRRFRKRARTDKTLWKKLARSVRKRLGRHVSGDEGDIHVTPDDHIEWDRIDRELRACGFEPAWSEDYLLFDARYDPRVFDEYQGKLTDYRCAVWVASGSASQATSS
jgi:ubiquinone/menaquinone biosynthesis C-methylase UbiE